MTGIGFIEQLQFSGWINGILEDDMGILNFSDGAQHPVTGVLVETEAAAITIPGGTLKANSVIEIEALWSLVAGGAPGSTDIRIYFGGVKYRDTTSQFYAPPGSAHTRTVIFCANSVTAQKGKAPSEVPYFYSELPIITSSVDTTEDVVISLTAQLADVGDTVILEAYAVRIVGT